MLPAMLQTPCGKYKCRRVPQGFRDGRATLTLAIDAGVVKDDVTLATKLCEDPIASGVNDAAAVLFDHGEYDGMMHFEVANGARLVGPHQRAVSSNVGRKNCCRPAGNLCPI
jgi:hypothetical protein